DCTGRPNEHHQGGCVHSPQRKSQSGAHAFNRLNRKKQPYGCFFLSSIHSIYDQTSSAIFTTCPSFFHCSSSVSRFPSSVEAKPHWGLRASWSSGTYPAASSMRFFTSSLFSNSPCFEVTRPSMIVRSSLSTCRSGSKPPARSVSYSRKNPSMLSLLKISAATGSYPPEEIHVERKFPRHICIVILRSSGRSETASLIVSRYFRTR